MEMIPDYQAQPDDCGKIEFVYAATRELESKNAFNKIDAFLRWVDVHTEDEVILLAILDATRYFREKLKAWQAFYDAVKDVLVEDFGRLEAENKLAGIPL